jgi:hypothetical protein
MFRRALSRGFMIYGKYMLGLDMKARALMAFRHRCEEPFEVENA